MGLSAALLRCGFSRNYALQKQCPSIKCRYYQLLTGFVQFTVVQALAYFLHPHTLTPSHHILTSYPHPPPHSSHPSSTHTPTVIRQGQRDLHLPVYCYGRLQLCPLHLCCTLRAILFFYIVCRMWKSLYKWAGRVRACNSTRGQCLDKIIGVLKIEHLVTYKKLCTCMQ